MRQPAGRLAIVRDGYRADATGDRELTERHPAADLRVYGPADVGIDRDRYERVGRVEVERGWDLG